MPDDESSSPDLRDDNFPFTEDELAAQFDRVFGGDSDDGPNTSSDEVVEPDSEELPSASESAPTDEPTDEPSTPEDTPPVEEPEELPSAATAPEVFEFAGRKFLKDDIEATLDWVTSLTPEQMARVQEALAPEPEAPATPAIPELPADEIIDPKLAEYVQQTYGTLASELQALREYQAQQAQLEQERRTAELRDALQHARTGTMDKFGLSDTDLAALEQRAAEAQIVPYLMNQGGRSYQEVFSEALETTYWMTPEFRERALNQSISEASERAAEEARKITERKANAASLSGGGAAASRTKAPPKTADEKFNAMVDEIATRMAET